MVDRRRLQRLMLCLIIATSVMGLLVFSCAACYRQVTNSPLTLPALYMGEAAPQAPPKSAETMCFDQLEKSLAKREKIAFLMDSCVEVVEMLLTELESCHASPGGLYVRPAPQRAPRRADATFTY